MCLGTAAVVVVVKYLTVQYIPVSNTVDCHSFPDITSVTNIHDTWLPTPNNCNLFCMVEASTEVGV